VGSEGDHWMIDNPVNPAHYQKRGGFEVIDFIEAICADLPGDEAALVMPIVKYVSRYRQKHPENPVRDLKKGLWFLDRLIKMVEAKMLAEMAADESVDRVSKLNVPAPWAPGSEEAALFKTNTARPGDVPGSRDRIPTFTTCRDCNAYSYDGRPLHHASTCGWRDPS
jgi:hypothetical protein